ncbi:MAG: hypothetical protein M3N98_05865 [Actinomycetota bacterium]|nr:hypothetical protein [Actinomycetota bacterium]
MALVTMVGASVALTGQSYAAVKTGRGSAYGFYAKVSLFGGPAKTRGPAPKVKLPAGGSTVAITASAASESAQYGPATVYSSGQTDISTQGKKTVTTSTDIFSVSAGPFTADEVTSTCQLFHLGLSGSATTSNGVLVTSTDANGNPVTTVNIPANPPPNDTYSGTIDNIGDSFTYVFNEQVTNANGSISVNAGHEYLLGPTAVGDLIFGQSSCG